MDNDLHKLRHELLQQTVSLAHGNGGRLTRDLVEGIFAFHFGDDLNTTVDAAPLSPVNGELVMTTDGFIVEPLEFPGGSIGSLAVNGTANDLAVVGARPLYLTLNAFIEEGLEIRLLDRLVADAARAAHAAGAAIVAGDTKVLRQGEGSGLYLGMAGVGVRGRTPKLGLEHIRVGDRLLVSGTIGDHGAAVLLARQEFGLTGNLRSDCGCLVGVAMALIDVPGLRFMRDPTRGGLATVAHDILRGTGCGVRLDEQNIPVSEAAKGVCEILGFDPLILPSEGRLVAVVAPAAAERSLAAMQQHGCPDAAIVGSITTESYVTLRTELGERLIEELEHDPLPRIC